MSLFDFFRRKPQNVTLKEPEFGEIFSVGMTGAGINVTPEKALQISAVYACVRILAETVSSLPLRVYRRTADGREPVDHPLNQLLGTSGNGEQTAMEQREFQMTSLGLRGNSYAAVSLTGRGDVAEINSLKPGFMHVDRDSSGRLAFDYREPGNSRTYSADQIWRVAGLGSDGVTGLSPVALARENMGLALTAEQSAARLFSNGHQSANALEFEHQLTEEQIDRLRRQFEDTYAGWKNAGKPLILESGMKAKQIGMSAADAQFLESRKFQIAEIARWYRVPLHMLNELDKATFSNIEHQSIEFVMHTIRPWLVRIEQTISRDLLSQRERNQGLFAAHTVEGLLRGDSKSRYEAYASGITNGWLSRNEVRRLENMNPAEGLDDYLVPLNMGGGSEEAQDLAQAENRVLAKEAADKSPGEFAAWLPGYYDRRVKHIESTLGVTAGHYKQLRIARMAKYTDPVAAVQAATKYTVLDIEALLDE